MIYLNGQPLPVTMFPDNTSQVWKLPESLLPPKTNKLIGRYAEVTWTFSNEGEFLQLAQLKDLLDEHEINTSLVLTYLPYGRQDKEISNKATFALHTFAMLLNFLDFRQVTIHDPHSSVALDLIYNSVPEYPTEQVERVILDTLTTLVCYPDKGAVSKYSEVYKEQIGSAYIYGEKVREQSSGQITSYQIVGKCAGENVLIVDDICDGGATFKLLAKDLLAAGAKSVMLFVTHGIFSKGTRTLFESGIQRVFTKDGEIGERTGSIQF